MVVKKNELVVKHFPEILSDEAVKEFFYYFGAVNVERMNNNSRLV